MNTFNDYLTKAKIDYKNKKNSTNKEYLEFHTDVSTKKKIVKSLFGKIR
tara:strand:+ start:24 stop:170 length:147 start_codon:yes stop_codon:yes gene_type:complete